MITHNLKIAIRNIALHKVQTVISVLGLALGMVCFTMSFLWLTYIGSYEDFVPEADRVYLIGNKGSAVIPEVSYPTPDLISDVLESVPEIESVSKITNTKQTIKSRLYTISEGEPMVKGAEDAEENAEFDVIEASNNFIEFFGVKVISGDASNVRENEIILTESTAKRLFGDSYPIGERVYVIYRDLSGEDRVKVVKAIVADHPDNTQFVYDAILALRPVEQARRYFNSMYNTFIKVHPGLTEDQINEKLKGTKFKVTRWNDPNSTFDAEFNYDIMPLRSLRTEYLEGDNSVKTQYVKVFLVIGIFVIAFSIINYVLTTISLIRSRSRQLAIRRLTGASLWDTVKLNVSETAMIFIVAAIIGLVVSLMTLPLFKEYAMITASERTLLYALVLYFVTIVIVGILIVGLATIIVLRRTQRSIIIGHQTQHSSVVLDKVSCFLQLTLSIGMIFATVVMYSQLRYLSQSNALGFKRTDMVGINWVGNNEDLKRQAKSLPMVKESLDSLGFIFPVNLAMASDAKLIDKDGSAKLEGYLNIMPVKQRQIPFWELVVLQGRMLRDGEPEMMVNESALKKFGGNQTIGSTIQLSDKSYQIVGVLANMYTVSPMAEPEATLYTADEIMSMEMFDTFTTFKLHPGQKQEFIKTLKDLDSEAKYIIKDVEQEYNQKLKSEFMLMRLLTVIGFCGLVVSLMGAYSVIALSLTQRRKEMALRKINGAQRSLIMGLFLRSNLYSLLAASAVAFPTVCIVMHRWLEQYPKHIAMPWYLIPVIILVLAILITLTVINKVYKASSENPADVLKE